MRKAMLLVAVFGVACSLWAQEPSMGTWKLNIAKSKLPPTSANLKETILVFRELDANTIEGKATQTLKDGKTTTTTWTTPKGGGIQTYKESSPEAGITTVSVSVDETTIYQLTLRDGRQANLSHITFSKDFKTFTMRGRGTDAQGKPVEYFSLYEKQ